MAPGPKTSLHARNGDDEAARLSPAQPTHERFSSVHGWMQQGRLLLVFALFSLWIVSAFWVVQQALSWPYIGASFSANPETSTITVTSVVAGGPAENAGLKEGDVIRALINPITNDRLALTGFEAISGRHQLHSFEMARNAGNALAATWPFLTQDKVRFVKADGSETTVPLTEMRPFTSLSIFVFTSLAQSLLVLVIACGIFVFAPPSIAVTLLAASGVGLVVNMLTNAVLAAKELMIPAYLISGVSLTNAVFSTLFAYGLLALLWHFPSKISRFPFATAIFCLGFGVLATQVFQLFEFPIHAFQFANLLPYPFAIAISLIQWRRTKNKPVERASVMWFMLSIYGMNLLVLLLYSVPIILRTPPILPPQAATFVLSLIYIGIALGTLRYRLFDIHRIWWRAIIWIAGGFVVFTADLLLISLFDLEQATALPLALFIAGFAYFPIRQAVFSQFVGSREIRLVDHVPSMIESFAHVEDTSEFEGRFVGFLRGVFQAAEIGKVVREGAERPALRDNGLTLYVPNLSGNGGFELVGKRSGRQLFSKQDIAVTTGFTRLVRTIARVRNQEVNRRQESRDRIVRDLHDDVGGKLLTQIIRAKDEDTAEQARDTLAALKEALIVVEDTQSVDFDIAWEQIVDDAKARFKQLGHRIVVDNQHTDTRVLSAREYLNLKRIFQETVSNAIKFGDPSSFRLAKRVEPGDRLVISASNAVARASSQTDPSLAHESIRGTGRGLANIARRAKEIDAQLTAQYTIDKKSFSVTVAIRMEA